MKRPKAPPAPEQVYTCSDCGRRYPFQGPPTYGGTHCPRCGHEAAEVLASPADAARRLDGAIEDLARYAAECGGAA